jgi:hypothetical protein
LTKNKMPTAFEGDGQVVGHSMKIFTSVPFIAEETDAGGMNGAPLARRKTV